MEVGQICRIAIATVGATELIKNFFDGKGGKKVGSFVAIGVGTGCTLISIFLPEVVLDAVTAISGAVVFYDTIFKSFKKLFEKMGKTDE